MRVVVKHPARTEPDGTEVEESVAAFRQGRIEAFTNPLTGETASKEEVAAALLKQARAEHPDKEVWLEVLVHNGDAPAKEGADGEVIEDPHGEGGTSRWVHHEQVPEGAVSPKGGRIHRELSAEIAARAEQSQEVAS